MGCYILDISSFFWLPVISVLPFHFRVAKYIYGLCYLRGVRRLNESGAPASFGTVGDGQEGCAEALAEVSTPICASGALRSPSPKLRT